MRSRHAAFMDYLVQRWLSSGACQQPIQGCSEAELEEIRVRQNAERLPEVYIEWLKRMGRESGMGYNADYPYILEVKERTFDRLRTSQILVFVHDAEGDCAVYCHINDDDPMVYWIGYDDANVEFELVVKEIGLLSSWLTDSIETAIESHERFQRNKLIQIVSEG